MKIFLLVIYSITVIGSIYSVKTVLDYFKLDMKCEEIHKDLVSILIVYTTDKRDEDTLKNNIEYVLEKIDKLDKDIDRYKLSKDIRNRILSRNELSRKELTNLLNILKENNHE